MSGAGSCSELAAKVAAAALEQGATNLEAKILSYVASFGGSNWQIDRTLADTIAKDRTGAHYHRESIGRARRSLTRAGFLNVKRIFAGQIPPDAKYPSAHGTTSKSIRWSAVGVTRPPKSARRREAERQRALERRERLATPRHAAPGAIVPSQPIARGKPPEPDSELAQVLQDFVHCQQSARGRQGAAANTSAAPCQGPDPPE